MPIRNKRTLGDFDPNKSDSADSTYSQSAARPPKSKSSRTHRGKPPRKRRRREYGADGSEDISDGSELSEESFDGTVEEEAIEIDERTGRPKRKAAKQRPSYGEESDGDSENFLEAGDSTAEEEPPPKKKGKAKSLVLKLKVPTPQPTPGPVRRSTRARSGSLSTIKPKPPDLPFAATRRSSRIAHDESDPIVALTDSGRHADIIRPGTRSPEGNYPRARKGAKGIKSLPATSEVEEESGSAQTKDEPDDYNQIDDIADVGVEIAASHDDPDEEIDEPQKRNKTDTQNATQGDVELLPDLEMDEPAVVPESGDDAPADDDSDDPVSQPRRNTRLGKRKRTEEVVDEPPLHSGGPPMRRALRSARETRRTVTSQTQRKGNRESSDFEPHAPEEGGDEDVSDSEASVSSPHKASQQREDDDSSNGRRNTRNAKGRSRSRRDLLSDEHDSAEELAEELQDLQSNRPRRAARAEILFDDKPQTRKRKPVDYRILRPDLTIPMDEDGPSVTTPSRRGRGGAGGAWQRSLFSTYGPFGGAGGPVPVFGGPGGIGAAAGADSDSSDDETMQRPRAPGIGGTIGMTPTAVAPSGFGVFPPAQVHGTEPAQALSGTPANLGKIKDKQTLADADPLGVDQNITFDAVGGLQGHIDQLKEMVTIPLLYPEIFQRFHVTPPRGVLFHGPPGTGKTLLARALASSVGAQGRKVTFYMRKGADALSKWVGEAERQLRLLFEEAKKTQPSIIFFDEIDGLAPVRSSKQEQIHASIVSTLLALMDGMDGRGQVIVIGATNRPDSIDPALRRPGRFDKEFYFPLPNTEARRTILDIHTKGWDPPPANALKDELAQMTKGYGGADLRALCTEATLNAVQRRYPQIYTSNVKLIIKPETISVTAKDFMISIKKMVPSSERSTSSGAAPLPKHVEPLLRYSFAEIKNVVAEILPQKKLLTALEEAQFEDAEDDRGMKTERMQQEFERSRVFRPRLLIRGIPGMGQQYLGGALLNHFEGLHVQSFDLPTLLSDSSRSSEAAVIQLFAEVRRHKPSVIYIPNVDTWYRTVGEAVISTFLGLLRTLAPTDPVLLLGIMESEEQYVDRQMLKDLFGFSKRNQFEIYRPQNLARREYFSSVIEYLNASPNEFPEPAHRVKRKPEELPHAPPEPIKETGALSKLELKAQKKKDRQLLNMLKLRIQPIMDQIRTKFKKFRTGVIDESHIRYLYDEEDPEIVSTDLPQEQRLQDYYRPYEKDKDERGEPGLKEKASGKFYYNMETVTIEKRLSNGYYKRPKDFLSDIKKLTKDAKTIGDQERLLKANELQANVEVDMGSIELQEPALVAECENVFIRETRREKDLVERANQSAVAEGRRLELLPTNVPPADTGLTTEQSSGPINFGLPITNGVGHHPKTPSHPSQQSQLTNGLYGGLSDLSDLRGPASHSNGTSDPSRGEGDLHMTNSEDGPSTERETQNSSFGPSAQTRPLNSYTGGPASLQQRMSVPGSLSQRSAITPMAEGTQPYDYANYASTTSSSKRISGSSGPLNTQNTQSSHGKHEGPDLSMLADTGPPNSQLPDTQEVIIYSQNSGSNQTSSQSQAHSQPTTSQPPSQPTSQPPVPPFSRPSNQHASIHSLLNADTPTKATRPDALPLTALVRDIAATEQLLDEIVARTSGCSVEQLEQIYSSLMDKIWKTRGDWNRARVTMEVGRVFVDVLEDMIDCQEFGAGSLEAIDM